MSNTWSPDLLHALADPRRDLELALRTVNGTAFGGTLQIATRSSTGWSTGLGAGLRIQAGASVAPRTWQTAAGQIQIPLAGINAARLVASRLVPGTIVEVLARVPKGPWDRIAAGVVRQLSRSGNAPSYTLVCDDLIAGLRTRLTSTISEDELFQYAKSDLTYAASIATTAYTPADGTLNVNSTTRLEREAGGIGCVEITPSGGGTPFYLTFTGRTATTLTGLSSGGQFSTSAVAAAIGSRVRCIPFLAGNPMSILLKILLSTGTANDSTGAPGTNGAYDMYPKTWGYGLPKDLVAISDVELCRKGVLVTTVAYNWQAIVTDSQPEGLAWLGAWLARAGIFLAMRQGCITARACQDITKSGWLYTANLTLSDQDAERVSWSLWDPNILGEAFNLTVDYSGGSTGLGNQTITSLPVLGLVRADLSDTLRGGDASTLALEVAGRRTVWETNVPGHISGLWPMHYARLCLGDVTRFSSPVLELFGAEEAQSGGRFSIRPMLIKRHMVDWFAGTVSMDLAFLSPDPST